MSDKNVTVEFLKKEVKDFCNERDWDPFNPPKDVAIGIATEASELLDIFRFKRESDIEKMMTDKKTREHISEELADTLFFILRFAEMNDFDLSESLKDKLEKNNKKYPIKLSKGKNLKYNEL